MDEVRQISSRADWRIFIELPWQLYCGDLHWVPPWRLTVRDAFDERQSLFCHAKPYTLLAVRHGKPVGRVAAAQVDSTLVGFALAVLDVNQAIKKLGNGELLPFGMLRLLALGIKSEFGSFGLGPMRYSESIEIKAVNRW